MEFVNIISNFISQVGFPIAAFIMMWHQNNTTTKSNTESITKMQECVNDNTTVTGKMYDLLVRLEEVSKD